MPTPTERERERDKEDRIADRAKLDDIITMVGEVKTDVGVLDAKLDITARYGKEHHHALFVQGEGGVVRVAEMNKNRHDLHDKLHERERQEDKDERERIQILHDKEINRHRWNVTTIMALIGMLLMFFGLLATYFVK